MPSPAELFGSLLFGVIGMAAVIYGKKSVEWKPMLIGVLLMTFPYLVSQIWLLYVIGCGLCAALFIFRD